MPIRIQNDLPVRKILEHENVFVMDENRSIHQDIRPLQICILNLMPKKEDTELQLLRLLSNTPLQVDVTFMMMKSHNHQNVSVQHLNKFYVNFEKIKNKKYDGLIITGAPVEKMAFEEVDYWAELCDIMQWSVTNVTSTIHICWAAQAGLYYHYGLQKQELPEKLSGVYEHYVLNRKKPILRGFDDFFLAPHSRYTTTAPKDIHACNDLTVLSESTGAGVLLSEAKEGRQYFVSGHLEYDRMTLNEEYFRDLDKGIEVKVPFNYYPNDNPNRHPNLSWRAHSYHFFTNWLNYYVYQLTPYDWTQE